jgi:hypothetical protein
MSDCGLCSADSCALNLATYRVWILLGCLKRTRRISYQQEISSNNVSARLASCKGWILCSQMSHAPYGFSPVTKHRVSSVTVKAGFAGPDALMGWPLPISSQAWQFQSKEVWQGEKHFALYFCFLLFSLLSRGISFHSCSLYLRSY